MKEYCSNIVCYFEWVETCACAVCVRVPVRVCLCVRGFELGYGPGL